MKTQEIERIIKRRKRLTQKQLFTRQHRLKDWLEEHHTSGRFWKIEEICKYVRDDEGNPYYILNKNKVSFLLNLLHYVQYHKA